VGFRGGEVKDDAVNQVLGKKKKQFRGGKRCFSRWEKEKKPKMKKNKVRDER